MPPTDSNTGPSLPRPSWTVHLSTALVARNVTTGRGRTSVKFEDYFWDALGEIARERRLAVNAVVAEIDRGRGATPLTRAIRLYILHWFRERPRHAATGP